MESKAISDLVEDFQLRRGERLAKGWASAYSRNNPIASDFHDCDRYQAFALICSEMKRKPDRRGQEVIEEGNAQETRVLVQMVEEGWEIVEQQARFTIWGTIDGRRCRIITGKADGKLVLAPEHPPPLAPFDVKSTSEFRYDALNTEQDLKEMDVWTRKWWRQLQLYLLGEGYELGFIIASNCRGGRKLIPVALDWNEADRLVKLAEATVRVGQRWQNLAAAPGVPMDPGQHLDPMLNALVEAGEEPTMGYHADFSICRTCDWRDKFCFPVDPVNEDGVPIRDWLEKTCATFLAKKEDAAAHAKANKELSKESKGNPLILAGKYVIEGKETKAGWRKTVRKAGE